MTVSPVKGSANPQTVFLSLSIISLIHILHVYKEATLLVHIGILEV